MQKNETFDATFATLRRLLARHEKQLLVQCDEPGNYQLCSRTMTDRTGRPLFVAAVQIKKSYVSYHLMPVYAAPKLLGGLSPELKKRMQGKACFNFKSIEPAQVKELSALTKAGIAGLDDLELPWARPAKR